MTSETPSSGVRTNILFSRIFPSLYHEAPSPFHGLSYSFSLLWYLLGRSRATSHLPVAPKFYPLD